MTKILVLDFQGFKDSQNEFIIKELAGFDGCKTFHIIFKPPFSFHTLSPKAQASAKWVIKNYHNLNWGVGCIPYHNLLNLLTTLTSSYDIVYMKGREKATFIQNLITSTVLELPEHPPLSMSQPQCVYHITNLCMCALTNVQQLYYSIVNTTKHK